MKLIHDLHFIHFQYTQDHYMFAYIGSEEVWKKAGA